MIYFILLNSLVLVSGVKLAKRFFNLDYVYDRILGAFLLFFAQIVLTCQILGLVNILSVNYLVIINSVIALFIWIAARRKTKRHILETDQKFSHLFLNNKVVIFCTAIILGFGLVKIFINLINPPFGWDSLNYHFTFPVEWLKHGNLSNPITINDDPAPSYFPINGSLFFLWLVIPFKNVFLADLGQLPFFIIAFVAILSISKKIGLDKEFSFYAAVLFTLIPNYFKQLEIAYVDIIVAALFFITLNFSLSLRKNCDLRNVILVAISLGLFIGIKTVCLVFSLVLVFLFIYILLKNLRRCGCLKLLNYIAISFFIIIICGGFGYLRNFVLTDNFLYPLNLEIFGKTILKGVIDSRSYLSYFKEYDYSLAKNLFHEGLGAQFIILFFPAIILSLPLIFIKNKKASFELYYILVSPLILWFMFRYIIPAANIRYLYNLMGLSAIIAFYVICLLNIPRKIIRVIVAICAFTSIFEFSGHTELIVSLLLTAGLFFLLPVSIKIMLTNKKIALCIAIISVFVSLALLKFLELDYIKNEYTRYKNTPFWCEAVEAWQWFNRNTQGNNVAYVGRPVPFPLYGTSFKNNVRYISVNHTQPLLHNFKNAKYIWDGDYISLHNNLEESGNYRQNPDYDIWLKNLMKENIDYLFIYSLHKVKDFKFPIENVWALGHPESFDLVFENKMIHIYRVRRLWN